MNCPYCQRITKINEIQDGSGVRSYYCNGSHCDVLWLVDSRGKTMQTTMYFSLQDKRAYGFFINHQQGVSKVYDLNSQETIFLLSSIPDWTPSNVARQVKKFLTFL